VWYFCSVAAICSVAAAGYWLTVRSALNSALDQGLRYRLVGLRQHLEVADTRHQQDIQSRFADISRFGELYQVFDEEGRLIMQSDGLEHRRGLQSPPRDLGAEIRYDTAGTPEFPVRIAWLKVTVVGQPVILGAVDPQRKYEGVLSAFTSVLLLSMPPIVTVAILCGVWFGRRALAPVARISEDARAITERSLSSRLAVPGSGDELQRLSETLNSMLQRIEESVNRMKQFTADASHELRAPMTLIYAAAQYSLRRQRTREELLASMQNILRETERTTVLMDDLLALARGDTGKDAPPLLALDAEPILREASDQARTLARDKALDVQLHIEERPLLIRADEASLRRLLLILVDNAVKFTPGGGTVAVKARRDETHAIVSVADSGVGIAPEDQAHIFERFWRADRVRNRESGGTGLGLSIARDIADKHSATITVASAVGRGSEFTVRLPLAVP
jgi:signal transduction histidine kinase